jgi:hypothetical protein
MFCPTKARRPRRKPPSLVFPIDVLTLLFPRPLVHLIMSYYPLPLLKPEAIWPPLHAVPFGDILFQAAGCTIVQSTYKKKPVLLRPFEAESNLARTYLSESKPKGHCILNDAQCFFVQSCTETDLMKIYGWYQEDSTCAVLVVEHGEPLSGRLGRSPPLTWKIRMAIAKSFIHALALIKDARKPSHRPFHVCKWEEISSQHMYVRSDGSAFLGFVPHKADLLTTSPEAPGVPPSSQVAVPEHIKGVKRCTPAVEVYLVGCLLYELAAGEQPWRGCSRKQIMRAFMADTQVRLPMESLHPLMKNMPRGVAELIHGCLAIDPTKRPLLKQVAASLGSL